MRYTAPSVIFEHESGRGLEVGGFQPFEAYDTVIANLDPALERRGAPASVTEALRAFPEGLTTAELASVMRPSDSVDADPGATAAELAELEEADEVMREPRGNDAVWRVPAGWEQPRPRAARPGSPPRGLPACSPPPATRRWMLRRLAPSGGRPRRRRRLR